ncbi:hypothetical protein SEUCBS140593_004546 [Sporothrix eucalyptigena]|uniref:Peptidase M3A/M3B catalytic domain-containing protein n=1 Tax=Sporothrix eucalyptigena TaxID=1812306 RepID=A0ABP0BP05_9PEZI
MLKLFSRCLELRFDRVPPEHAASSSWHEDVETWAVWDEGQKSGDEFVGYLYVDLLARPNKYRGSQDVNL